VGLHLELPGGRGQRRVREVTQPEVGIEVAPIVVAAGGGAPVGDGVRHRGQGEVRHALGQCNRPHRVICLIDDDCPVAVWMTVGGHPRRTVDRSDLRPRVRRQRRRVERRIFNGVAHVEHLRLAERFDVDEGTTVKEPELAMQRIRHAVGHVHVLVTETHIELQCLHDRRHVVALNAHHLTHAIGIDRAHAHPLVDVHRRAGVLVQAATHGERHPQRLHAMETAEHVVVRNRQQLRTRQRVEVCKPSSHDHLPPPPTETSHHADCPYRNTAEFSATTVEDTCCSAPRQKGGQWVRSASRAASSSFSAASRADGAIARSRWSMRAASPAPS